MFSNHLFCACIYIFFMCFFYSCVFSIPRTKGDHSTRKSCFLCFSRFFRHRTSDQYLNNISSCGFALIFYLAYHSRKSQRIQLYKSTDRCRKKILSIPILENIQEKDLKKIVPWGLFGLICGILKMQELEKHTSTMSCPLKPYRIFVCFIALREKQRILSRGLS